MTKQSIFGVIMMITLVTALTSMPILLQQQSAQGFAIEWVGRKAPIVVSGDNVYVTWASNKTGDWEVLFRASNNNGATFGDKINLSNSTGAESEDARVAASDDSVYVSWHDNKTGNVDTYMRASTDGGQTFGDIIRINGTGTLPQELEFLLKIPGTDIFEDSAEDTKIAASGDNVYVVSWDKKTGNWEVFLARSTDNGQTIEDTINISNSPDTRSDAAEIAAEGDNVYMTWFETSKDGKKVDSLLRVSDDNGATFGPILNLATNGTIGEAEEGEAEEGEAEEGEAEEGGE
jgi:hypothetical protein